MQVVIAGADNAVHGKFNVPGWFPGRNLGAKLDDLLRRMPTAAKLDLLLGPYSIDRQTLTLIGQHDRQTYTEDAMANAVKQVSLWFASPTAYTDGSR